MLKQHPKKLVLLAVLVAASAYMFWPGFSVGEPATSPVAVYVEQFGEENTARLNVVGIEPHIRPQDFASARHLRARLSHYLNAARDNGFLQENTLVLMPGHIGTGLLAAGHKSRVLKANSVDAALVPVIARNLPSFAKNYYIFDAPDKILAATVRSQSAIAATALQDVFAGLAKEYKTTVIAGSVLLMTPGIYPDGLTYGHGPVFHTSFVFGPDGEPLVDAIRQIQPSPGEMSVAKPSLTEFLPVFSRGGVNYAVALGADASRDDVLDYLKRQQVEILLSPQFFDTEAPRTATFVTNAGFLWGMAVSMKGEGWGFKAEARASILLHGEPVGIQNADTVGRIYNLWVGPAKTMTSAVPPNSDSPDFPQ